MWADQKVTPELIQKEVRKWSPESTQTGARTTTGNSQNPLNCKSAPRKDPSASLCVTRPDAFVLDECLLGYRTQRTSWESSGEHSNFTRVGGESRNE